MGQIARVGLHENHRSLWGQCGITNILLTCAPLSFQVSRKLPVGSKGYLKIALRCLLSPDLESARNSRSYNLWCFEVHKQTFDQFRRCCSHKHTATQQKMTVTIEISHRLVILIAREPPQCPTVDVQQQRTQHGIRNPSSG